MNKSLALRNKIYRFCFLILSFLLFLYLLYFLVNGERGILSYFKINKKYNLMQEELIVLKNSNKDLEEKISRLSPNTLDLDYLDEKIRINTGKISENELVIINNN
tara:strand:- start:38 stop:352 length:315 start_codon:yes stop_codon:yes gene_type:complete